MSPDSRVLIKHGWTSDPPSMAARRHDGRVRVLRHRGVVSQKVWVHAPLPPFLSLGPWAGCSHPLLVSQVQRLQNEDALNPPQLEISQYASFCHGDFFLIPSLLLLVSCSSNFSYLLTFVVPYHTSLPLCPSLLAFCSVSCVNVFHIAYCLCLPSSNRSFYAFLCVILLICVSVCVSGFPSGASGKEPAC